jgi:dihydroorotate dehydrogenase
MSFYKSIVRPVLFKFDPEQVHRFTVRACGSLGRVGLVRSCARAMFGPIDDPRLRTTVAGIQFSNPIGLGAGFDKNGEAVRLLACLGLGLIDVGSVSLHASAGNPKPRLFRMPLDEAIVCNLGVPNHGVEVVAPRLASQKLPVPLAVTVVQTNTGKAKDPDVAIAEIVATVRRFVGIPDLLFISAACANSPSGKPFADKDRLRKLLDLLGEVDGLPPVFMKVNLSSFDEIDEVLSVTAPFPFIRGFRPGAILPRALGQGFKTPASELEKMTGSVSGPPLKPIMLELMKQWYARIDPSRYALMATGGVRSGQDAYDAIRRGASLVGFVAGFIYEGPALARRIAVELSELLAKDGFKNVADAVGVDSAKASHLASKKATM